MGSVANPFYNTTTSLPSPSTASTANPYAPQVPMGTSASSSPGFSAYSSPYTTSSPTTPGIVAPSQNPNSGEVGVSGTGASLGFPTTTSGQQQLQQSLNKTYGSGLGTMLYNFLASGAGYNQSAINNLISAMQPGFESAQQNLMQQFSAGGNRFGSGAQIGLASLQSQEQLDVGQLESQMYEQSVNDYINVLMGASSADATRILQSGSGSILSGLLGSGLLSSIGGSTLEGLSGGGGLSDVLSSIAGGLE